MKENNKDHASQEGLSSDPDKMPPHIPISNDMQAIENLLESYEAKPFSADFSKNVLRSIKQDTTGQPGTILRLVPSYTLKLAASVLVLLIAGFLLWNQPRTYSASPGSMSTVTFPDGSTVLLNSGSSITYKSFIGKNTRAVHLEGEGFFDIVSLNKPFIVETASADIRVLGTRFSVSSWSSSAAFQTTVTLEEGKVSVAPSGMPERTRDMQPSQTITIYSDASFSEIQTHTAETTDNLLSWRHGGYVFQRQPLGAIIQQLQRRGNMAIIVPDSLISIPVTYINPTPLTVEEVLEELSQAYSFSFRPSANGFELFRP